MNANGINRLSLDGCGVLPPLDDGEPATGKSDRPAARGKPKGKRGRRRAKVGERFSC
jgi:hypothetical protein